MHPNSHTKTGQSAMTFSIKVRNVCRSLSGTAPAYLAADCQLVSDEDLRSVGTVDSRTCVETAVSRLQV